MPSLISCVLLNNLLKTQKYSSHMTEPVKSITLIPPSACRFCLLLLTVLDTKRRVLRTKCKATQHSCISTTARMRRSTRAVERQDRLTIRVLYNNNGLKINFCFLVTGRRLRRFHDRPKKSAASDASAGRPGRAVERHRRKRTHPASDVSKLRRVDDVSGQRPRHVLRSM